MEGKEGNAVPVCDEQAFVVRTNSLETYKAL